MKVGLTHCRLEDYKKKMKEEVSTNDSWRAGHPIIKKLALHDSAAVVELQSKKQAPKSCRPGIPK